MIEMLQKLFAIEFAIQTTWTKCLIEINTSIIVNMNKNVNIQRIIFLTNHSKTISRKYFFQNHKKYFVTIHKVFIFKWSLLSFSLLTFFVLSIDSIFENRSSSNVRRARVSSFFWSKLLFCWLWYVFDVITFWNRKVFERATFDSDFEQQSIKSSAKSIKIFSNVVFLIEKYFVDHTSLRIWICFSNFRFVNNQFLKTLRSMKYSKLTDSINFWLIMIADQYLKWRVMLNDKI